jgi:hypothetical protein
VNSENLNNLITEALAIEVRDAKEAGALGFMARALVQATLPHSKMLGTEFTRNNGLFTLSILALQKVGLPYGSIPRLLLAWVTTEAARTKNRQIILGKSLSTFMQQLDIVPTGGRWGTITRLRDQMQRLFASSIKCFYSNEDVLAIHSVELIEDAVLWWHPKNPNQASFFESTLILSERFFKEITNNPVPIDMRAMKSLSKSPLAIDIYCWLTYRMSYLKNATTVPWEILENQFGSNYKQTRQFKAAFLRQLRSVLVVYPECKIERAERGLVLKPSRSHIAFVDKPVS